MDISGSGSGLYNSFSNKRYSFSSLADLRSYLGSKPNLAERDFDSILKELYTSGNFKTSDINEAVKILNDYLESRISEVYSGLGSGSMSGEEALGISSQMGLPGFDPGIQDLISNKISQDNATTAYDRDISARDTSLLSTANQLQHLGLNPGSAISLGGSSTPNLGIAQSPTLTAAQLSQQNKMNQYNQKQAMSRQLISMVGSLGRAAIGGSTYGFARSAAAKAVQATSAAAKAAIRRPISKDRGHEDDPDSWYIY